jgi:hypothetical protein
MENDIHDLADDCAAVEEYTASGELIPSEWTASRDEEGLERAGWRLVWEMDGRDSPPERPMSASVYVGKDRRRAGRADGVRREHVGRVQKPDGVPEVCAGVSLSAGGAFGL